MMENITQEAKSQMEKAIDVLKKQLASIRTGRAHLSLLDGIKIDYYDVLTPLAQVAHLSTPDARTLLIKPWERHLVKLIEKAILEANLGFSPMSDGEIIRISIPPLTEERRREFAKQARQKGEDAKLSARHARRDANEALKASLKEGVVTEDEEKKALKSMQEMTDRFIVEIDKILDHKEKEIMEV